MYQWYAHLHCPTLRCSPSCLQGIHFRFMPDMRQVSHALQVSTGVQHIQRRLTLLWRQEHLEGGDGQYLALRRPLRHTAGWLAGNPELMRLLSGFGSQRAAHLCSSPLLPTFAIAAPPLSLASVPSSRPQLYSEAGVPTRQFMGVPVFQAEGLTVTTQETVRGNRGQRTGGLFC